MESGDSNTRQSSKNSEQNENINRKSSQDEDVYLTPKCMLKNSTRKNALGQVIPQKQNESKSNEKTDENGYTLARAESCREPVIKISLRRKTTIKDIESLEVKKNPSKTRRNTGFLANVTKWRCRQSIIVSGFILILIVVIGALCGLVLYKDNGNKFVTGSSHTLIFCCFII